MKFRPSQKTYSIISALGMRAVAIATTAGVAAAGVFWLGESAFGIASLSLVTTGLLSTVAAGGVGRVILRDLGEKPYANGLAFLNANTKNILLWSLLAATLHIAIASFLLMQVGEIEFNKTWFILLGTLHTLHAGWLALFADLHRAAKRNITADLILGRLGGPLAAIIALASLVAAKMFSQTSPTMLLLGYAAGCFCALAFAIVKAYEQTQWGIGPEHLYQKVHRSYALQLVASQAVGPFNAAIPAWFATFVLSAEQIGVLQFSMQMAAPIGATMLAVQSRFIANLGISNKEQRNTKDLQQIHDRAAAPIAALSLGAAGIVLAALYPASTLFSPQLRPLLIGLVCAAVAIQLWNAFLGITGTQLQLSGNAAIVFRSGLLRAVSTAALIVVLGDQPLGFALALILPGFFWPYTLLRAVKSRTGIDTFCLRKEPYIDLASDMRSKRRKIAS